MYRAIGGRLRFGCVIRASLGLMLAVSCAFGCHERSTAVAEIADAASADAARMDAARMDAAPMNGPCDGTYGAEPNPTGSPIGGGDGYIDIVTTGNREITTAISGAAFKTLVEGAAAGDVVFIRGDLTINLTGNLDIVIPAGVTLASDRGHNGSLGALLTYNTTTNSTPVLRSGGENVRITGIRLRGPWIRPGGELYDENDCPSGDNSAGIELRHLRTKVDNNDIWAFGYTAVNVRDVGSDSSIPLASPNLPLIHHNRLRNCCRSGLGYGVVLRGSEVIVEANDFQGNRHHVAGSGQTTDSYELRYNVFGAAVSHAIDMHCDQRAQYLPPGELPELWEDGTAFAGRRMYIHHNTFPPTAPVSVRIRGIPDMAADVQCNWFQYDDDRVMVWQHLCPIGNASSSSVSQSLPSIHMNVSDNATGDSAPVPRDIDTYVKFFDGSNDAAKCRCCQTQ